MAKRDRISNRKSLGAGKNHKRNKNPKLSPFQREQKRDRLANQAPTLGQKRDFPAKQRLVFNYFHEKAEREEAKKEQKRQRDEELGIVEDVEKMGKARRRKMARLEAEGNSEEAPTAVQSPAASSSSLSRTAAKRNSGAISHVPSLNEELREGAAPLESRIDMSVVRKKEKKQAKSLERRKERAAERNANLVAELANVIKRGGKKKKSSNVGDREDEYEKEIIQMQREKAKQDAIDKAAKIVAEKAAAAAAAEAEAAAGGGKRKKISFGEQGEEDGATAADGKHTVARPAPKQVRDFYHMVDVVRYGDRVDAPPVFAAVPDKNSAVSKLAARLSAEEAAELAAKKKGGAARLLSSGAGTFAERKRLAALGLGPRVSGTMEEEVTTHADGNQSTKSMSSEFESLRAKVLASYQKNKVQRYQQHQQEKRTQGGGSTNVTLDTTKKMPVDLKHQFPLI